VKNQESSLYLIIVINPSIAIGNSPLNIAYGQNLKISPNEIRENNKNIPN
jgi:hypothetical protein